MNRSIFIASLLVPAVIACGSSSTDSPSSNALPAAPGADAGPPPAPSGPATACVWKQNTETVCDGDTLPATWHDECHDGPCKDVSFDGNPVFAGACSSYDQYRSQSEVATSCADWWSKGGFNASTPKRFSCSSPQPVTAATLLAYHPAAAPVANACTEQELADVTTFWVYLRDDRVRSVVSPTCAACALSDVASSSWAPLAVKDGLIKAINFGGCIETMTGSHACAKAIQDYRDCQMQACLGCDGDPGECARIADDGTCKAFADAIWPVCQTVDPNVMTMAHEICDGSNDHATVEDAVRVACVAKP